LSCAPAIVPAAADAPIANSRTLIAEIDRIRSEWDGRLVARRDSGAWRLLAVFARRPVLDARTVARELGVQLPNAYPSLNKLADAGIISRKAEHGFGPVWRADDVLRAVDAFAERAGRRARS